MAIIKRSVKGEALTHAEHDQNHDYIEQIYGYFVDPDETDQGATGNGETLKAHIDSIGSAVATIYFPAGAYTLTTSETVPSNITLEFDAGAVIDGAGTLTGSNAKIEAGQHQIWGSSLTLAGTWDLRKVYAEWFGATGDGSTDDSTPITDALSLAALSTKTLTLLGKTYLASIILPDGTTLTGEGSSGYPNIVTNSPTVLKRPAASAYVVDMSGQSTSLMHLDIDGNGATTGQDGIICDDGDYGYIHRVKVIDCDNGFAGDSVNPAGSFIFSESVFRNNVTGIRNVRDTSIDNCTISANTTHGIYINQGQNRIDNSWVEWQRSDSTTSLNSVLVNNAATGIYLDSNATETIITGVQFDRNAGHSIQIQGATNTKITNNFFKGCGWGGDFTADTRVSIRCVGSPDGVSIVGNSWEARNHGPSTIEGPYSPLKAIDFASATRTVEEGNNFGDIANPLNLKVDDFTWSLSGSGTNEYYLIDATNTSNHPQIIEPDYVEGTGTTLVVGTAGALAADEWDWADNDTLGFSTVYVRLLSGNDPDNVAETVKAYYNLYNVDMQSASDIKTENFKDAVFNQRVALSTTETITLKTRDLITPSSHRKGMKLIIYGDQQTTASESYAEFPFVLDRDSGADVTVHTGTIIKHLENFTVGWNGDVTILEIDITASTMGDEITIDLENTDGTRFVDITVLLI